MGNGTIKYPKFDSQESVLNGVLSLLDEALQLIDLNDANAIDEYDIYYKGDMNKWMTLAKSLKFRTLMVMVDKDPSKAAAGWRNGCISSGQFGISLLYRSG